MRYFNGFCLSGEEALFEPYLIKSDFTVAGFSYGAILAFEYALTCKERIDTLQLFSPAFFQNKEAKFKKLQTLFFAKDPDAYCQTFLNNIALPSHICMKPFFKQDTAKALEHLLYYRWHEEKLSSLHERGVRIEVYLGADDAIIDALTCKDFFTPFAEVYYIKRVGHILILP